MMQHLITSVLKGSAAARAGLREGDTLLRLNGEEIEDEIDYQALIAGRNIEISFTRDGQPMTARVRKQEGEPLGLRFGESMTLRARTCRNRCEFCFIAQMPEGLRDTLYVRDDDWRYSLMMGNFVTLTNVSEAEMERIIKRKASPLYISVHTTNPELRRGMMGNRFAGDILSRLNRLGQAGIRFHCQIVVCPGRNDGEELTRTLNDLAELIPSALSVALVPVGLTRFREGLPKLEPFNRESAQRLLRQIAPIQQKCLREHGTSFVFPSDEFYCMSGDPLPEEDWYEDFPQIENGVGLLRRFIAETEEAAEYDRGYGQEAAVVSRRNILLATGVSAAPFMTELARKYAPEGVQVRVLPVINRFFGESVTVAGLLTGGDLLRAFDEDGLNGIDEILLSADMLRHERDRFLDDMTVEEFTGRLSVPVRFVECDGDSFYTALRE